MSSVLVLCGPTGAGKTQALLNAATDPDLVGRWGAPPIEVISADSRQIYRHLEIGTALPSTEERSRLPHHLVSFLDPREQFDLGAFVRRCDELVTEIHRRGRLAVIAGGTGFYLRGYLCGLPDTPPGSPAVRRELQERLDREGLEVLRAELETVDPVSAGAIAPADTYRTIRALEIYHTTGRRRSEFPRTETLRPGVDPRVLGLSCPREVLHRRIENRVDQMFRRGLAREVEGLLEMGYTGEDPGMRTIGYAEFLSGEGDPEKIRQRIVYNTRRYAKRQYTYLRRLPGIRWVDADDSEQIFAALRQIRI